MSNVVSRGLIESDHDFAKIAHAIFESLPEMIAMGGSDFRYTYVNESWVT